MRSGREGGAETTEGIRSVLAEATDPFILGLPMVEREAFFFCAGGVGGCCEPEGMRSGHARAEAGYEKLYRRIGGRGLVAAGEAAGGEGPRTESTTEGAAATAEATAGAGLEPDGQATDAVDSDSGSDGTGGPQATN